MKRINIGFLFPLAALAILVCALSQQLFILPPLGKLLDPFIGAIQNEDDRPLQAKELTIPARELEAPVQVFFDERKVPHIYAQHTTDLYFAQGYVTAFFRLWQMDFGSYAAAGRLSEIFAKKEFLDYDRNQRRLGIMDAAQRSLKLIMADRETSAALNAYTRGVNAYIQQLDYRNMPLEYKLLGYQPELWTNLKSTLILKSMASRMTGYEEDLFMSKMILALGEERFNQLFPEYYPDAHPVMNTDRPAATAAAQYAKIPGYLNYAFLSANSVIAESAWNPRLGSNSWAVSGKMTASGFPILANDPHLNLSLPNVWMEMQLNAPGVNVYGVTIPGTPAIIIGFNENIAWGITNGADDVKDWYKLKISPDYRQYELDGKWLPLEVRRETIQRKGQPVFYDTVYSTLHGPIVFNKSFPGKDPDMADMALRWELHRPSNEFLTFIQLNKARNYREYKAAIWHYHCPLQNFTFAGKDNNIAIHHQGSMPLKWPGQGKFILDGTTSAHLYTQYVPADSLPQLLNPACNYVQSANQRPTYSNYAYYYNGYYNETRASRIEQLLSAKQQVDVDAMKAMQLDNVNAFTVMALPVLLANVKPAALSKAQQQTLAAFKQWNGSYDYDNKIARLYNLWWRNVKNDTWDELRNYRFFIKSPEDEVLLNLIQQDTHNAYFDRQHTPQREDAAEIITNAFITAFAENEQSRKEGRERWSDFHKVNLLHLTNLRAFSKMGLPVAGQQEALNAISANWGPSWRMIVELGDRPRAYGIYPGGQSGNPGSRYYDSFVDDWNKGKYYTLNFFMSLKEAKQQASGAWKLNNR
ncbi:penicillin acylase family protein [uncultured Chitinophaga sp.]|jgi:Protein related to penicillin acylase|uniref:penicillin acylase family protein n=1 Tax=uncultured Chitinophaga sp. TaxID=339340 RepID=UPI00262B38D8|nr:penicillin acylase family protein [uncultured Chitinophaga sp.]